MTNLPTEAFSSALRSLYSRYGYSRYKMNKFEEYDLYAKNKDFLISDSVITFTDMDGKLMALKPDVTLSIVKNTRDEPGIRKLYYNENVYRVSKGTHSFKEIMQVGLEAIGQIYEYCIYEVLKLAEKLAQGRFENYEELGSPEMREFFSQYKVAVGSTGNLGLSIGIISAAIGFQVTVHMSADSRQWKKDMLRSKGVTVIEYPDDYEKAVAQGRKEAEEDPMCHFVDDENSLDLFAGYSVAGKRLAAQLREQNIKVDKDHRLYVYLPCGVGGAPGGVTYGLKEYFGDNAYCFFAEPTHAPCMALGLISGKLNEISVGDIGIDGRTEADGLAVGRPSGLVASAMQTRLTGCFTVDDEKLYPYLSALKDREGIFIEPSACAAFAGPGHVCGYEGEAFPAPDENSIHIIWATGGNMVPEEEKKAYYERGK